MEVIVVLVVIILIVVSIIKAMRSNEVPGTPAAGLAEYQAQRESLKAVISDIVSQHIDTLSSRHRILVRKDHYGVVDGKPWDKEVGHFVEKVILPRLPTSIADHENLYFMKKLVTDDVHRYNLRRILNRHTQSEATSPIEFESICAEVLRRAGWDASLTKGSGDQGADIIAKKSGQTMVVQCKFYAGPVGNKAVQEALAAKSFYNADKAVVVCKSDYTKSARELAAATSVKIIAFDQLNKFALS